MSLLMLLQRRHHRCEQTANLFMGYTYRRDTPALPQVDPALTSDLP